MATSQPSRDTVTSQLNPVHSLTPFFLQKPLKFYSHLHLGLKSDFQTKILDAVFTHPLPNSISVPALYTKTARRISILSNPVVDRKVQKKKKDGVRGLN